MMQSFFCSYLTFGCFLDHHATPRRGAPARAGGASPPPWRRWRRSARGKTRHGVVGGAAGVAAHHVEQAALGAGHQQQQPLLRRDAQDVLARDDEVGELGRDANRQLVDRLPRHLRRRQRVVRGRPAGAGGDGRRLARQRPAPRGDAAGRLRFAAVAAARRAAARRARRSSPAAAAATASAAPPSRHGDRPSPSDRASTKATP